MEDAPDYTPEVAPAEPPVDVDVTDTPDLPLEPAPPITSQFLFVDVAALRAKQLRRGATLRYDVEPGTTAPKKPERQAMEEVRRQLVPYSIPPWKGTRPDDAQA
jgi:DNA-directed RNA polymerase subunit K/omega